MKKNIAIFGSTGSIGRNTLSVIRRCPERFVVKALTAHTNIDLLAKQAAEFKPGVVCVTKEHDVTRLASMLDKDIRILHGESGLRWIASMDGLDLAMVAIVGLNALIPVLTAIDNRLDVGLANKEVLVAMGPIIIERVKKANVNLIPVDSEHNAIFQCLKGHDLGQVSSITLTASGGPFLNTPIDRFKDILPSEALRHPNWSMGSKISVDSATMVNKGLEVIEAHWLFDIPVEGINVLIHPQSIVHSLVEFLDGSCLALVSLPDMRLPISYALTYPERLALDLPHLDLKGLREMTFIPPDTVRFPALKLAYDVLRAGGTAPAVFNAADEIAVGQFLRGRIDFSAIYRTILHTCEMHKPARIDGVESILSADTWARKTASEYISRNIEH